MRKTLDAWAFLAWLNDERPASDWVEELLKRAEKGELILFINMINLGEVYYRLARLRGEDIAKEFLNDIKKMAIQTISATDRLVLKAASLKAKYPIAYADAFAAVTAMEKEATLVTGDPDFKEIEKKNVIKIEWLQKGK